jgi:hypothetical protein
MAAGKRTTSRKVSRSKPATDAPSKGMRIKLAGLHNTRDIRAMLHEAVDRIEALGIKTVRGANLYLTPCDDNGSPLTRLADRQRVRDMTIAEPYRSAADEHGV